ncbi:Bug family tripartite tricarboxylate transporter substrate binding protein [Bradyrhizobium archetypum]|uniref:Tripartite tricarboxylate transporter substrate binding protein n=1 Tax=Bradyrhizobium archetypum TaxID=2721160 RepID=A0A7Y4HB36_9BRAD|nr:tripartite tricarboxylate transporter substrate binding protein [Bradyrhizobium archetypum]NOJ50482.1 tripartite tricarboxylate transporter substrate binding protein [Bradyrhizobium archetypum]
MKHAHSNIGYFLVLVLGLVALLPRTMQAVEYPVRPVRLLVGLAAGGGTDAVARIVADKLSEQLAQRFVVENRTGMGGNLANEAVINSAPDGYTLLFTGSNSTISMSAYKRLPFNFQRDTTPVAGIMRFPNMMVVPPSLTVTTVQEFIDYAKANPGKLSMASSGYGTSVHLSGELFKAMTKIDMVHVPYRGAAAAYPDLMTGKVHVLFDNITGVIEAVRSGRLRGLGVTTPTRWPSLPDIPAIAETVPGFEASIWYGIFAPKGTPPEIIDVLNKAVNAALADPGVLARFEALQGLPMPMSSREFGEFVSDDVERWRKAVEFAGVSIE